jgi:hypothetical protein
MQKSAAEAAASAGRHDDVHRSAADAASVHVRVTLHNTACVCKVRRFNFENRSLSPCHACNNTVFRFCAPLMREACRMGQAKNGAAHCAVRALSEI